MHHINGLRCEAKRPNDWIDPLGTRKVLVELKLRKVALLGLLAFTAYGASAQEQLCPKPTSTPVLSPVIPPDVAFAPPDQNRQASADTFSWQSFVALNWPVELDGSADDNRRIGERPDGDNRTVWEQWSTTADMFDVAAGAKPQWGVKFVPQACEQYYKPGIKLLDQASKTDDFFEEAFSVGALVDQNGRFARYEIVTNRDMFDYIIDRDLNTLEGQSAYDGDVSFNCGTSSGSGPGAIVLKASWKILGEGDDPGKFHRREALVYTPGRFNSDGADSCVPQQVGLVGLHIVHKTSQQPQWVWSSFEHVDNVPECKPQNSFYSFDRSPHKIVNSQCPTEGSFSFFSAPCPDDDPGCASCNTAPRGNVAGNQKLFHLDRKAQRSQICRQMALETTAPPTTCAWKQALLAVNPNSVWANYILVGTQWNQKLSDASCSSDNNYVPENIKPTYRSTTTPMPLGNTTMEGYESPTVNSPENPSCIRCHAGATDTTGRSSDFIWFLRKELQ